MKPKPHNDYWSTHPPQQRRVFYMHTLDGEPAKYWPGKQVGFVGRNTPVPLVATLDQIRKEQAASRLWRLKKGYLELMDYGWQKVEWRGE